MGLAFVVAVILLAVLTGAIPRAGAVAPGATGNVTDTTGNRSPAVTRLTPTSENTPGLWSDGVTPPLSDHQARRLFAYGLPLPQRALTASPDEASPDQASPEQASPEQAAPDQEETGPQPLERVHDEDFEELGSVSNNSPRGIWSDGDVMYVVDAHDGRVYTYNMPDAIDARLASLSLSDIDIGEFDRNRREYRGIVAEGATETVVTVQAMQHHTSIEIEPPDADGIDENGHQVGLDGIDAITITVTSPDGSRVLVYRVLPGPGERPQPCLRGATAVGFSLVIYKGGSVEELQGCAESRGIVALYTLHEGAYVPYILAAPAFVNQPFRELYPDGVPALTTLIVRSSGAPSAGPVGDVGIPWPGADCLRGEVAAGFSFVLYEGGSTGELASCAQGLDITSLHALSGGQWFSYILGAPDFVNQPFRDLFSDGLPSVTPLVARSDGPPRAGSGAGQ